MNPFWYPLGHSVTVDLEGGESFEILAIEAETMILADKYRWQPDVIQEMPISQRRRYADAVTKLRNEEQRKLQEARAKMKTKK